MINARRPPPPTPGGPPPRIGDDYPPGTPVDIYNEPGFDSDEFSDESDDYETPEPGEKLKPKNYPGDSSEDEDDDDDDYVKPDINGPPPRPPKGEMKQLSPPTQNKRAPGKDPPSHGVARPPPPPPSSVFGRDTDVDEKPPERSTTLAPPAVGFPRDGKFRPVPPPMIRGYPQDEETYEIPTQEETEYEIPNEQGMARPPQPRPPAPPLPELRVPPPPPLPVATKTAPPSHPHHKENSVPPIPPPSAQNPLKSPISNGDPVGGFKMIDINTQRLKDTKLRPTVPNLGKPQEPTSPKHGVDPFTLSVTDKMKRFAGHLQLGDTEESKPPAPVPSPRGVLPPPPPSKQPSPPESPATSRRPLPLIPASPPHNQEEDELCKQMWYFGEAGRTEADSSVKAVGTPGSFLVRKSNRGGTDQPYTLVVWYNNKVFNLPIRVRSDNKYALGRYKEFEQTFQTVAEMVDYHMKSVEIMLAGDNGGYTKLTVPCRKK